MTAPRLAIGFALVVFLAAAAVACSDPAPDDATDPVNEPTDSESASPGRSDSESDAESDAASDGELAVREEYRGYSIYEMLEAGDEAVVWNRVIRTPEEYDEFVATIPPTLPQLTENPPVNDDPLIAHPSIDFASDMLVVCVRGSMHVGPEITRVAVEGDVLVIDVRHPALGETLNDQAMLGMGRYHAVIVPRSDGTPEFRVTTEDG